MSELKGGSDYMEPEFEILVEGVEAQDLYFIEREVPDTQVKERQTTQGQTSFGIPGVIEAAILIGTIGAATAAIAWVLRHTKKGRFKIRRTKKPDGEETEELTASWDEAKSSDEVVKQVDGWIKSLGGAGELPNESS